MPPAFRSTTCVSQYGMRVAGDLFTPKTLDRKARNAAIIVGQPMGAMKEHSANLYATKMNQAPRRTWRWINLTEYLWHRTSLQTPSDTA